MPDWVNQAYLEYSKRLSGECNLQLVEIPAAKRSKNNCAEKIMREEGVRILASVPNNTYILALDVKGKSWTTNALAKKMGQWMQMGKDISLLIGGPDGLSEACATTADEHWSLSTLTFPHPLVRVILAEQLYRAYSILKNHPYHRAG